MTMRIWLELRGRLRWWVGVLALMGVVSLFLSVAGEIRSASAWLGIDGWSGFALDVLAMVMLFSERGL